MMAYSRFPLLACCLLLSFLNAKIAAGCFASIVRFGDSISDTSNLQIIGNIPRVSHPPYGDTFFHRPTGRFSDGRLIIDFLAEAIGLPFVRPYLSGVERDDGFRYGANFAVGLATALDAAYFRYRGIDVPGAKYSLSTQLKWFRQWLPTLCSTASDCDSLISKSLFLVGEIGVNDYNHPVSGGSSFAEGYVIGNSATGRKMDLNARVPYAHGMGIISDTFFEVTQTNCRGQNYQSPTNTLCAGYMDTFNRFLSEINLGHILELKCDTEAKPMTVSLNRRRILKQMLDLNEPPPFPDLRCRTYAYVLFYYWANHDSVRQALHIKKDAPIKEWRRCRGELPYEKGHGSNIKYHHGVLSRGYRAAPWCTVVIRTCLSIAFVRLIRNYLLPG